MLWVGQYISQVSQFKQDPCPRLQWWAFGDLRDRRCPFADGSLPESMKWSLILQARCGSLRHHRTAFPRRRWHRLRPYRRVIVIHLRRFSVWAPSFSSISSISANFQWHPNRRHRTNLPPPCASSIFSSSSLSSCAFLTCVPSPRHRSNPCGRGVHTPQTHPNHQQWNRFRRHRCPPPLTQMSSTAIIILCDHPCAFCARPSLPCSWFNYNKWYRIDAFKLNGLEKRSRVILLLDCWENIQFFIF